MKLAGNIEQIAETLTDAVLEADGGYFEIKSVFKDKIKSLKA